MNPDDAYQAISEVFNDFSSFCSVRGTVSEADTRVKIIDRVLKDVLGWPEQSIIREESINGGFIDYTLTTVTRRRLLLVEAKREGVSFEVPNSTIKSQYKLDSSIKSNKELYSAIEQAQRYCNENATRYSIVTNGYSWVVFRALRDDIPWRTGVARVFKSAGDIKKNFKEFWRLLAYNEVLAGSLDNEFAKIHYKSRSLHRIIDDIYNSDRLLVRNRLHSQLGPIIDQIFGDIAEQDQVEIMQKCYVHSKTLTVLDEDLKQIICDVTPKFAQKSGAVEAVPGKYDSGTFGYELNQATKEANGSVFLLLGGIGSGKSTFIKRFFKHVGKAFIDDAGIWFYISFLSPPKQEDLEPFVYSHILEQIRDKYPLLDLESPTTILDAFQDEIRKVNKTILFKETEDEYSRRISKHLALWSSDVILYTSVLLSYCKKKGNAIVLCFDNVDQLSPEYQGNIFLFAQKITKDINSVTIVALREESYYAANSRNTFTAYNIKSFHVASPDFRILIGTRLNYACQVLKRPDNEIRLILKSGVLIDKQMILDFLEIIRYSLFDRNRNIVRYIESTAFGNMRYALEMFSRFLCSGNTDVDKMLSIFTAQGKYNVGFHEFAKSVMLGDKFYYRESESGTINVFNCGTEKNSSHFTCLRILNSLLAYRGASSIAGDGFVDISIILSEFIDTFDNEDDFISSADRLLRRSLIETDTRSNVTIRQSSYFRITSAGWYYAMYMTRSFAYLDLVLHDTPLSDEGVVASLLFMLKEIERIPEMNRAERTYKRIDRVEVFLDYLVKEEKKEFDENLLGLNERPIAYAIMQPIVQQMKKEETDIKRKLSKSE